jgi:hypothetical protein
MRLSLRALVLAAVFASPAPTCAADDETKLPAKCEQCQIAGSGRYLVLKLKGTRALSVYDATTQKLSALEISEDDIVFAAGGDTVLVYLKEANELQSWNIPTAKMVKAKGFADKPNVQTLVMGHSRGDLALVRMGRAPTGGLGQDSLIDTTEIRLTQIKYQFLGGGGGRSWEQSQLRANGDMSRLVDWAVAPTPNTVALINRTESGYQYVSNYGLPACVIPGDDGRTYTPLGTAMELDPGYNPTFGGSPFKMSEPIRGKTLVPAIGGQFALGVSREGGLTLYQTKVAEALAPLGDFPGWDPPKPDPRPGFGGFTGPDGVNIRPDDLGPGAFGEGKNLLTLDRRICFAPGMDHIVFLPHSNDKIVQRKFDLKATLDAGGEEYLMVVSVPQRRAKGGVAWEYQLKTVAKSGPVKYELPKAPEGMKVADDGKITWTPPKGVIGRAPVEVRGTDAKGKIVRQVFEISFE